MKTAQSRLTAIERKMNENPALSEMTGQVCVPALRCGVRTEVRDRRTGTTFTQLCVGRMSDRAMPCPWPLSEGTIGDRIAFTHSPILRQNGDESSQKAVLDIVGPRQIRPSAGANGSSESGGNSSFAMVTVLSEPLEANISASLVLTPSGQAADPSRRQAERVVGDGMQNESTQGDTDEPQEHRQQENGPAIILGPVVGRVEVVAQSGIVRESCCVPVLLEVDREGDVACVVSLDKFTNTLYNVPINQGCLAGENPEF